MESGERIAALEKALEEAIEILRDQHEFGVENGLLEDEERAAEWIEELQLVLDGDE